METKDNIITELVETGSDISGGIAGAVIGGLVAGPPGAIIGGASGPIITKIFKKVGAEIQNRFTSPREVIRIGAVYGFAINRIQENVKDGLTIRDDSFFSNIEFRRADSEEIFEGVVLGAQKEYEEKKVKYLGNLYGNISTNSNISREHANQLIRTTNSLSYRQLCILQILLEKRGDNSNQNQKLRGLDEYNIKKGDVIVEIRDLQQRGLITIVARWKDVDDNSLPIPLNDISISENGSDFCNYLSLDKIPRLELDELNNEMKLKP